MSDFQFVGKAYAMQIASPRRANAVKASFNGKAVALTEDFALKYSLWTLVATRWRCSRIATATDPGFFEASALLRLPTASAPLAPRTIVALFDTSLSMQWEKLEREFQALEALAAVAEAGGRVQSAGL